MGQKNFKGTVSIFNDAGHIRLRWRYNGERYSFSTAPYTRVNLLEAKKTALIIEEDIKEKRFDQTLKRYKEQRQPELVYEAVPAKYS